MRILPAVLILGGLGSAAHAQVAPADIDVTGTYNGTWGAMQLQQSGAHVTGAYAFRDGKIDGTVDGNTLRFTWQGDAGSGRGVLVRSSDGTFVGSWGNGDNDHDGGVWQLAPAQAGTLFAASPALTPADTTTEPAPGPHAGSWSLDLTLPIDVTFGSSSTTVGMGGVGVGLGERLSDRWYLGATGEVEALMGTDFNASNTPSMRLRAGGELRYIFAEGTGSASVNCGPSFPVPITGWVGVRAGGESLDGGSSFGSYGDVSIGADWWLGQFQIGMYVQAGLSVEPAGAYGVDDGASTSTSTTSTYAGLGWRLTRDALH